MIVLDTHVLLWVDRDDAALGTHTRALIDDAWRRGVDVGVSAISFWECAMLAQRGRIALPSPVEAWRAEILEAGVAEVPLDGRIALRAAALEGLHRDPADRFIVATALQQRARLVTADEKLLAWTSELICVDART